MRVLLTITLCSTLSQLAIAQQQPTQTELPARVLQTETAVVPPVTLLHGQMRAPGMSAGNVGIGVADPLSKLHVTGGGLLIAGSTGGTPLSGAGIRMMWIPEKVAFRAGIVFDDQWDDAHIGDGSFVGGGVDGVASGDAAFVGGGHSNTASGIRAFTGGGGGHIASGSESAVVGGNMNTASAQHSFIGGGSSNAASGLGAFVGGGIHNTASGLNAVVLGGSNNNASFVYSTAAGGSHNTASGFMSFIGGGEQNAASGRATFTGGGRGLLAKSFSEVVFGNFNTNYTPVDTNAWDLNDRLFVLGNGTASDARSNAVTVLKNGRVGIGTDAPVALLHASGGAVLFAGDEGSTPVSGEGTRLMWIPEKSAFRAGRVFADQWDDNNIGIASFVGGGSDNKASGFLASTCGGSNITIAGFIASAVGGTNNQIPGAYAFAAGGINNNIGGSKSSVIGGTFNNVVGEAAFIGGGEYNDVSGRSAFSGGGEYNTIEGWRAFAGGGSNHTVTGDDAFIGGGFENSALANYSGIMGGLGNMVSDVGTYGFIGGGSNNHVNGQSATIVGGTSNTTTGLLSFIGGGSGHSASGLYSSIVGGLQNTTSGDRSFIGGGIDNQATGLSTFVGGGASNRAFADFSFVGGGAQNSTTADYSFVGGGRANDLNLIAEDGAIVGGLANFGAGNRIFIGGGYSNFVVGHDAAAVGGSSNTLHASEGFIGGGNNLLANAYCNAVFGQFNVDLGSSQTSWDPNHQLFVVGNGLDAANRSNALTILKNGNTGIGTSAPGAFRLAVTHGTYGVKIQSAGSGTEFWELYHASGSNPLQLYNHNGTLLGAFDYSTGEYTYASDRSLKRDIAPMSSVLPALMQLNPSTYIYKSDVQNRTRLGFIAQEVEKIFPELVSKPQSTDRANTYTMNYAGFGVLAVKGVQELAVQVETQQARIDALESELAELRKAIAELRK